MITNANGRPIPTPTPTITMNLESQSVLVGAPCDVMLLSLESPTMTEGLLLVQVNCGA
jgi:hypothetical protein